jgi:CheY-like chemotaxis protein
MPSQLVCRPEQVLPVGVLRVSGVLDLVTSDALDHAVARCLSAQPEALLVDIDGMDVGDPLGLAVLRSVVSRTAQWPAVPIVLCGASAAEAGAVAASPGVTASASCAEALEQTAEEPEPRRIRARLRPVPDACRQVRQVVGKACSAWQRSDLTASAALVATELVANVVRHAHTTMEFTVGLRDGRMSLTVRDGSRALPLTAEPVGTQVGGRGLRLVRELSEAWGVLPIVDGKVVWAHVTA